MEKNKLQEKLIIASMEVHCIPNLCVLCALCVIISVFLFEEAAKKDTVRWTVSGNSDLILLSQQH
jgi:hypothetical protein